MPPPPALFRPSRKRRLSSCTDLVLALFLLSAATSAAAPAAPAPPLPTVLFQLSDLHLCEWASSSPSLLASKGATAADAVAWARAVVAPARRALSLSSPQSPPAPSSPSDAPSSSPSRPPRVFSVPLLVTGDLTHAKTRDGGTRQSRAEWSAYGELLDALGRAAGIAEASVLDVRGNHDGFDVPSRGSPQDHFPEFAAAGRRASKSGSSPPNPGRRVYAAAVSREGAVTHLDDAVDADLLLAAGSSSSPSPSSPSPSPSLPSCPALLLLGVDAAQAPGLSGSNNFAGRLTPALAEGVVAAARVLRAAAARACRGEAGAGGGGSSSSSSSAFSTSSRPPLLAYGHFPLSTVERSTSTASGAKKRRRGGEGTVSSPRGQGEDDGGGGGGGDLDPLPLPLHLSELLASRPVSADAYVAGHLHSLFGGRMHRALEKEEAPESGDNAVLAEWEAASFADSRRFRLLVADRGFLSFSDWHWHSPAGPAAYANSTAAVAEEIDGEGAAPNPRPFVSAAVSETSGLQPSRAAAGAWLLHLSSPPDARFAAAFASSSSSSSSSSAAADHDSGGLALGSLRALALPLALGGGGGGGGAGEPVPPRRVRASWACVPSGERGAAELLPSSSSSSSSASPSPPSSFFFEAPWPEGGCPAGDHAAEVELEALSEGGGGEVAARAPARPVALVPSSPSSAASASASAASSTVGVGPLGPRFPLPAGTSALEAFFVSVDWARSARALFWSLWAAWLVAGLLLPRAAVVVFRVRALRGNEGARKGAAGPGAPPSDLDLGDALSAAASRAGPGLLGPLVAGLLAWPLVAAADNASPLSCCASSERGGAEEGERESSGEGAGGGGGKGSSAPPPSSSSSLSSSSSSLSFSSLFSAAPLTWKVQVIYAVYIAVGPWAVVRTLSASPPGLYFPWGVLVRMPDGGGAAAATAAPAAPLSRLLPSLLSSLSAVPTPDAARVGAMHLCFCVAPFSLWLAAVVSALRRGERRGEAERRRRSATRAAAARGAAGGDGASTAPLLPLTPPASAPASARKTPGSSPTKRGGEADLVALERPREAKATAAATAAKEEEEGEEAGRGGSPPPLLLPLLSLLATAALLLSGLAGCCWLSLNFARHVAWQVGGGPAALTGLGLTWGAPAGATALAARAAAGSFERRRRRRRRGNEGAAAGPFSGGRGPGKKGE